METPELTRQIKLPGAPFVVRMDKDRTQAWLDRHSSVTPEKAQEQMVDLVRQLRDKGFKKIDLEAIRNGLSGLCEGTPICFAKGVPSVNGQDGWVDYKFDTNPAEKTWAASEDERVDFKNRDEINNVRTGDLLAEVTPPTPFEFGVDVFGEEITAKKGRETRILTGKNVRLDENQRKAFSEIDGCVKLVRNRVSVDNVKRIRSNVDFSTGNIKFNGDVIVEGDVREGFGVAAQGSITIAGSVDRATLKSEADINLEGGLYGKEDIAISAEGNVLLGFAENARIKAGGNVYVRNSLVNCDVECEGKLHLRATGKSLIGGHVLAVQGVVANSLGNPRIPTRTVIEFGKRQDLAQRLRALAFEFERADRQRRLELRAEMEALRDEYEKVKSAKVIARHITYPGVVFVSGKASYEVTHEIGRMVFYKIEGKNEILTRPIGQKAEAEAEAEASEDAEA